MTACGQLTRQCRWGSHPEQDVEELSKRDHLVPAIQCADLAADLTFR